VSCNGEHGGVVAWIEPRSSFPIAQMVYAVVFEQWIVSGLPASRVRLRSVAPTTASACWPSG
jgi:hypothetical protein